MSDNFLKKVNYIAGLLPIGAIFGLVFHLANVEIKDLDLWLHLGVGKFITLHHFVPRHDILSHTIAGAPWINHEWLFQVIVYNIFNLFGPEGLIKMQVVIVMLTMVLLLLLGYSKNRQLMVAFILFVVCMVYQQRFTIRPDLYSLLFFTSFIFVLALHIDRKWAAPVLFVVQVLWTNIHGFFFFGPLFVLIGLVSEWMKRHVRLPYEWNESGRLTDEEYRRLKFIFIIVLLACVLNPCGLKGAWYPVGVFFSLSGENKIFFDYIQELQKPVLWGSFFQDNQFVFYKMLIFFSVASFIFNRRRIDVSALFFWLVFLVFSLKAARNTPFFAFASYLVIITNILNISAKDVIPLRFTGKKFQHITSIVVKLLFVIWLFQFAEGAAARSYYDFDKYEFKSEFGGISQRSYPDKAVRFLVENKVQGNFFNDFNSGAYLVGHVFPDIKVFIDGRTEVYGGEFFRRYQDIWEKGNARLLEEMIGRHNITGALLNSSTQHIPTDILNYFYRNKNWVPVYFDYDGVIFLRDVSKNKELIKRFVIDFKEWEPIKLDLLKVGPVGISPHYNYYRGFTLESMGLDDQALAEVKEAIKIAPGYSKVYELAGKIYAKKKNYEQAFEYFRIAAIGSPNDKKARHNLALCYFDLRAYEGAIKEYGKIISLWPGDPKAYFLLSKVYAKDKQYDQAIETLTKAHRLAPDDATDILGIGDLIYEQEDYEKALEVYALALKTNKDPGQVHKKIGTAYRAMGQEQKAVEEFRRALEVNPDDEDLKKEIGR